MRGNIRAGSPGTQGPKTGQSQGFNRRREGEAVRDRGIPAIVKPNGEIKLPKHVLRGKRNIGARTMQLADRDFAKLRRARQRVKDLYRRARMNVNPTLENAAKFLSGGRTEFMFYLELAAREDERLKPIARSWGRMKEAERRRASIDSLCEKLAPELTPAKILGAVAAAAFELNYNYSELIAAVGHRLVVQRSIKEALNPSGIADRQLHFQHTKYVPTPRGSSVNVFQGMRVGLGEKDEPSGLPPFETEAIEATNRVRMTQSEQPHPKGPESKG